MLEIEGDLGPMSSYAGACAGILSALNTTTNKSRFIGTFMSKTKEAFMTDSIAANEAGSENIRHMFDWGSNGQISDKPLFKLMKMGSGNARYLTFDFLPSTEPVPLPSAAAGTIEGATLGKLRPHIFRQKALVMETMESVTIAPKNASALFIPAADQPRGYLMTTKPVSVNPGGNSTGGFVMWWTTWFDTRAKEVVQGSANLTAEFIAKTGQTVLRDTATGTFAKASDTSFAYANAQARAEELTTAMIATTYSDD